MVTHVLPGENGSPTGRAQRCGNEGIGQMSSFRGKTIQVGSLQEFRGFLHEAHEVVPVVVAEDENNILSIYLFGEKDLK